MYKVKLIDKKEVAAGTMAFYFAKPAGYTFVAGQHTDLSEINPVETDAEGASRVFCYASSPQEEFLMFATRMRDTAFKNNLKNASLGTEIEVGEPRGKMIIDMPDKDYVFLAGGIGITPFRSMVLDAAARGLPNKISLFYSNRTPEEAAFLDELQNVDNPNFKLIPIFTKTTGHLTRDTLSNSLPDLITPIYFVAGPPQFVLAMKDLLASVGVDQNSIRSEGFEGY